MIQQIKTENHHQNFLYTFASIIEILIGVGAIALSITGIFKGYFVMGVVIYFLVNLAYVGFYLKTGKGILGKMLTKHKTLKIASCVIYPLVLMGFKLALTM